MRSPTGYALAHPQIGSGGPLLCHFGVQRRLSTFGAAGKPDASVPTYR